MSGCHGGCCAAFTLVPDPDLMACEGGPKRCGDEEYVADMVIEITPAEAVARHAAFGGSESIDTRLRYYKCRHWDEGTRLCTAYEDRPAMCRNFPYGGACPHGCDCKGDKMEVDKAI